MSITSFSIENFKGFNHETAFDIKPLTIFLGPNSSGKSSGIHALATLSQTASTPNTKVPLILDHEYADVHLGRFIDVIHTKKYTDSISFKLKIENFEQANPFEESKETEKGDLNVSVSYKSTKRTQEIYLSNMHITFNEHKFLVKKVQNKPEYDVIDMSINKKFRTTLERPFSIAFPTNITDDFPVGQYFLMGNFLRQIETRLQNILYLGPFRQSPRRIYPYRGGVPEHVGPEGELAMQMIANEHISSQSKTHTKQISRWLSIMGLAKNINLSRQGKSDLFTANLSLQEGKQFPIADLGYGLSQILPVLTQCSFAPENSILLFEQPEIHLHSIAARKLPEVFIETIKEKNAKIIIETHSPDVIRSVFNSIRDKKINVNDVVIYRIERVNGESVVKPIDIEFDGEDIDVYEKWENGISM